MKIALTLAAGLLALSSVAYAGNNNNNNGGKSKGQDSTTTGSLKGNGLNEDGSSDDAMKCRAHTAGAALCGEKTHQK